jgi:LEA14-like dessication related protein
MKKLLLLLLVFTLSCTTMQIPEPGVTLADLKLTSISFFETSLGGTIRVQNNSSKELILNGSEHHLTINNIDLGTARSDQQITIPAYGNGTQDFRMTMSNLALFTRLEKIINSKKFNYLIESRLFLPGFFGLRSIKTKTEGQY